MNKLLTSILLMAALLFAEEFHIDKSKDNMVKFISDAPIESFEGVTDNIDGYMYYKSLDDLTDNQLYFEVDLTTLDTGIDLRNRHMRDNYLETEKYRFTFFEGKIDELIVVNDNEFNVVVSGSMFIHGVTNQIEVNGIMNKVGNGYMVEANFPIALSDYKIDIPQLMFMKINEEMKLELKFYLEEHTQNEE